jgi:hypothetical protein
LGNTTRTWSNNRRAFGSPFEFSSSAPLNRSLGWKKTPGKMPRLNAILCSVPLGRGVRGMDVDMDMESEFAETGGFRDARRAKTRRNKTHSCAFGGTSFGKGRRARAGEVADGNTRAREVARQGLEGRTRA